MTGWLQALAGSARAGTTLDSGGTDAGSVPIDTGPTLPGATGVTGETGYGWGVPCETGGSDGEPCTDTAVIISGSPAAQLAGEPGGATCSSGCAATPSDVGFALPVIFVVLLLRRWR